MLYQPVNCEINMRTIKVTCKKTMRSKRAHSTLVIMMKLLALGVLLTTLTGCFPYATSYVHLDAPGITHDAGCAGNRDHRVDVDYRIDHDRIDRDAATGDVRNQEKIGHSALRAAIAPINAGRSYR